MTRADWILTIIIAFCASFIIGGAYETMESWSEPTEWHRPYDPHVSYFVMDAPKEEKADDKEHSADNCPYGLCLKHGKKLSWMKDEEAWEER